MSWLNLRWFSFLRDPDGDPVQQAAAADGRALVLDSDAVAQLTAAVTALNSLLDRLPAALSGGRLAVEDQHSGLSQEATQLTVAGIVNAALDAALSTRATENTLQQVLTRLGDILASTEAIAIDADSIAIDADTINLSTDELESVMQQVRDRLPTALGQQASADSLAVVLSTAQEAILATLADKLTGLEAAAGNLDVPLSAVRDAAAGVLSNAQLRASAVAVADDYSGLLLTADQAGADAVLTFTLGSAAAFVIVDVDNTDPGDNTLRIARATLDGTDPSATLGLRCRSGSSTYLPFPTAGVVKVFSGAGVTVSVQAGTRA